MSSSNTVTQIRTGPIGQTLWRLSLPNVISNVLLTLVTVADAWFVSRLGTTALASLAIVFPFQVLMQMFGNGAIGGGIASALSRALGAKRQLDADALARHALLIGGVMLLGFVIVLGLFARHVFTWLGADGEALEGAVRYATVTFGAASAVWLFYAMFAIYRGTGHMAVPARALVISSIVQIVLSGGLTLGWGPLPSLGIVGPGVAFIVSQGGTGLALFLLARNGRLGIHIRPGPIRWQPIATIMRVGGLGMVNSLTIVFAVVVVTSLVGQYGTAALAGYGLGSRLELMLVPLAFGIGGALTTAVGINMGAGQYQRARDFAWFGAKVSAVILGPLGILLAIVPGLWTGLFTSDTDALYYATQYLHIVAPLYGVFFVGQTLYFASQGTGRMAIPVSIGVLRLLTVSGIGLLAGSLQAPLWVVFMGVALGMTVIGVGMTASLLGPAWRAPH
ncbi:MAG TPA: MATE family efflux transporter [Orrella sp.]